MNTEQRRLALQKFGNYIESAISLSQMQKRQQCSQQQNNLSISISDINEENLPKIQLVNDLLQNHSNITQTISNTYENVENIISKINLLKNYKINVQVMMDRMTSILEIKKLSYGLGNDLQEIYRNLDIYYQLKHKVCFVQKYIIKIETQIQLIQKQYQLQFDSELVKSNSNTLADVSKILQLIRKNTTLHEGSITTAEQLTSTTTEQLTSFYLQIIKKEFKKIEGQLFNIPIIGNLSESHTYIFFELAKNAMKIIAGLITTYKTNILKLSGQGGLHTVIIKIFEFVCQNLILQILIREKKYYEVDKIVLNQNKFTLKEKDFNLLKNYFQEFNTIWNQIERLKIHLYSQLPSDYPKILDFNIDLQNAINSDSFVEINSSVILYMQAHIRCQLDKLLKKSPFVNSICQFDNAFFKELQSHKDKYLHNLEAQDFLEDTLTLLQKGIEKSLETLNLLIISAVLNFTNHNLLNEDVFYAFNQLFNRCAAKIQSNDVKPIQGIVLILNTLAHMPSALKTFLHNIKIPPEIDQNRIKIQLQELVFNNSEKSHYFIDELLNKIVQSQWFRYQIIQDHQKVLTSHWQHFQSKTLDRFIQKMCKAHSQILLETEFNKKYTQIAAITFEKDLRKIINIYQKYSHSILPNFKRILEFIEILMMEKDQDFKNVEKIYGSRYSEAEIKKIWSLKC